MPSFYEFDSFRLDPVRRVLLRDGEPVALKPKAFETLLALVERHGEVVEKHDLITRVWPDSFVEESNLTQHISLVRKALGESPQERRYIGTIPGRGYQFVAAVQELMDEPDGAPQTATEAPPPTETQTDDTADGRHTTTTHVPVALPARHWRPRTPLLAACLLLAVAAALLLYFRFTQHSAAGQPIRTLAVLPFADAGGGDEYLRLGLTDALITRFSGLKQIAVRPTSDVLKYKSGVPDARGAAEELGVDAVVVGVMQRAGERVRVTAQMIRARDGATIWAQTFDERWDNLFAVQDAIAARLGDAIAPPLSGEERAKLAKPYTRDVEAFRLGSLAIMVWRETWDWTTANELFQRSRALDDSSVNLHQSYGIFLASQGRVDEGIKELQRTLESHPNNLSLMNVLGTFYIYAHRYDDAIKQNQAVLRLNAIHTSALNGIGWAYALKGNYTEAINTLEKATRLDVRTDVNTLAFLGYAYAAAGKREQAQAVLVKLGELQQQGHGSWGAMAVVYVALGEREQAFAHLEKALAAHEWWLSSLKVNPLFDPLRADPRCADLIRRTGLSP
jgi:DNA-binding winged helix-turn-helix (wHTH) protein/TolB-like protein/Flp pilus assembly protein TadD